MLTKNIGYFQSKPVNIPKITILLDHGYHLKYLREELEKVYPQMMTKIRFELSAKPSKQQKKDQGKSGFVPVAARWVIERSNAWMERCKILVKNFERTLANATAKVNLCFIRLMVKRLAAPSQMSNGFYIACYWLTKMYLPVYLVTLDSRNARIVIIAGEESVIVINKQGELSYDQPEL